MAKYEAPEGDSYADLVQDEQDVKPGKGGTLPAPKRRQSPNQVAFELLQRDLKFLAMAPACDRAEEVAKVKAKITGFLESDTEVGPIAVQSLVKRFVEFVGQEFVDGIGE